MVSYPSPFSPAIPTAHAAAVRAWPWPARPSRAACWYALARAGLRLAARHWLAGLSAQREAALPPGPKIIALNHPNLTEPALLPLLFPDQLCGLIQADVFDVPLLGSWLARAGQLPVTRTDGAALLAAAGRKLQAGCSIALCPEGRLNHGGALGRGHTGAVRLALHSGAPIVPVGFYVPPQHLLEFRGLRYGRPATGRIQTGGVCYVNVGRAWSPAPVPPGVPAYRHLRQATNELMARIESLTQGAAVRAAAAL